MSVTPARPQLALVLAGGQGRRMGGRDKALLPLRDGDTLLTGLLARLSGQAERVALSANGDPARFAATRLAVLPDDVPDAGPLAGVLAGLDRLAGPDGWLLTVPVDTPLIPPDLARRLADAASAGSVACARARSGSRAHPLVALWSATLRAPLRQALREQGMRKVAAFQDQHATVEVAWPVLPHDPFINVNTPEDLHLLHRLVAAGPSPLADREHVGIG